MSSVLHPQLVIKDCSSFNLTSPSNLTFGRHHRSLSFPHKSPSNASLRFTPTRIITAAYSGDTSAAAAPPPPEPSPAKALRRILDMPGVHQGPACFDGLSANLVERAGFLYCFTSGFSISAARLGLPDTGFLSYGEMVDQEQQITQYVSISVIGDGDNGYGNAMNVKRTIKGYIRAGFSGILLEDQDALAALKGGRIPPPGSMPSFEEVKKVLGFNRYYEEEKQYYSDNSQLSSEKLDTSIYDLQGTAKKTTKRSESSRSRC